MILLIFFWISGTESVKIIQSRRVVSNDAKEGGLKRPESTTPQELEEVREFTGIARNTNV